MKSSRFPAFTASIGSEVPTRALLEFRYRSGLPILLPRTDRSGELIFHQVLGPPSELPTSPNGIPEPDPDRDPVFPVEEIDLVIVPGLGFDPHGNRLGQGQGYFDRFLAQLGPSVPKIALAFDCQVVPRLPVEPHDIAVDAVITESAIYRFAEEIRETQSVEETRGWASEIARGIPPPTLIRLSGELGSGKTEWARGFLEALGWKGRVRSPSFTLENTYDLGPGLCVYHLDGYRLASPSHLDVDRLNEILDDPTGIVLVEWPERFGDVLSPFSMRFDFSRAGEQTRLIRKQVYCTPHADLYPLGERVEV